MHKLKSKILAITTVTIVAIFMLASVMPIASATPTITSIDPTSGPVGEEVRVIGTIDTGGGTYNITWDGQLQNLGSTGYNLTTGQCAAGSTNVDDTIIVPSSVNGSYGIRIGDIYEGTVSTAFLFTVETAHYIEAVVPSPQLQIQEGASVTIQVNVTGGEANTVYSANVTVTDPDGGTSSAVVSLSNTTTTGSGYGNTAYSGSFSTGAHTNYTGTYDIAFNETLATGSFFVGLTNATEYNRFQTVDTTVWGYTPGQNVTIDIKDPSDVSVTGYPKEVNATDGTTTDNWSILKNASLGIYTVTVTNATGTYPKPIADTQTFEVTAKGILSVTEVNAPTPSPANRTITVVWEFNITYPDNSFYNVTDFETITVSIYYNTTFVTNITLTTANCNQTALKWNATWTIPKGQTVGINYNFTIVAEAIVDKEGNSGPSATNSSSAFTVIKADLTVGTINLVTPDVTNRTLTASANFNITYPDGTTYFTSTDLGWVNVTVYMNTTSIENISLAPADYDSASKNWTVSWKIPWNASLGTGYTFNVTVYAVEDTIEPTPNSGPTTSIPSLPFEVKAANLTVSAINTDKDSYGREETLTVWFTATYPDGSAVTTGSAPINITMVDGSKTNITASYKAANEQFEATYYIKHDDPVGTWNSTLFAFNLTDAASNTGPIVDRFKTFEVIKVLVYVLDVEVDVGSIHFRGETAQFYALISRQGVAIDADVTATLYTPDTTKETPTATHIDTGLYKISYTIAVDATEGTYTLVVNASKVIEAEVSAKGTNLGSFLLSPTLTGWHARIVAINGTVATIKTDVGEIVVSIEAINLKVVAINGTTATIKTDVGTIKGTVTSIDGNVATIQTDVGVVKADVSDVATDVSDVATDVSDIAEKGVTVDLTPVWIAVVLSLIAAIAACYAVATIHRKLA